MLRYFLNGVRSHSVFPAFAYTTAFYDVISYVNMLLMCITARWSSCYGAQYYSSYRFRKPRYSVKVVAYISYSAQTIICFAVSNAKGSRALFMFFEEVSCTNIFLREKLQTSFRMKYNVQCCVVFIRTVSGRDVQCTPLPYGHLVKSCCWIYLKLLTRHIV